MNTTLFFRKVSNKLFPYSLRLRWKKLTSNLARKFWKPLKMLTPSETVDYIANTGCSIARFGDGELNIAAYGASLGFQKADDALKKRLRQVLKNKNKKLLLCMTNRINAVTDEERKKLPEYWQKALSIHFRSWTKLIKTKCLYGDANLSRLTEDTGYENTMRFIEHIKSLWKDRNVIMIEGEKTRFGVGNDLFDGVSSLQRVLGPAESAFDYYKQILDLGIDVAERTDNPLIILALGPTATVLAYDLTEKGYQALDIGHLDISYEKFKTGKNDAVPGKYTNESNGGNIVADCLDDDYLSQIVANIG